MVKLVVLYGTPTDPEAFDSYYLGTHVPLADRLPGLRRNEVARGVPGADGSPPPYYLQAELYFDSAEDMAAALASRAGMVTSADVANFATGSVTMFTAEVVRP
jgi:uncharacterized protein (TIGR02118 family)